MGAGGLEQGRAGSQGGILSPASALPPRFYPSPPPPQGCSHRPPVFQDNNVLASLPLQYSQQQYQRQDLE